MDRVETLWRSRLRRLYAAKCRFAAALDRLFRHSTSLATRLLLSDQRKATGREISRLGLIIDATDGAASGRLPVARTATIPSREAMTVPRDVASACAPNSPVVS